MATLFGWMGLAALSLLGMTSPAHGAGSLSTATFAGGCFWCMEKRLTPLQYQVTQEGGTEPPFKNEYWDNKAAGVYVDVVSGEPLFLSLDKYDSGTGWPSFSKPLAPEAVTERQDRSLFSVRTEIRSAQANSHLGHVFDDGPPPTGKRYCMNSAALRFVARDRLAAEGYSDLLRYFQ